MEVPTSFLYLSQRTLEELKITTEQAVESLEQLICSQADGKTWAAPKAVIQPADGTYPAKPGDG